MAKRKEAVRENFEALPGNLALNQANLDEWAEQIPHLLPLHILDSDTEAVWRSVQARRFLMQARAEVLASMATRPNGVGLLEFLNAHGFTWKQIEEAKRNGLSL